jgi:hypothetical protein
LNSEKTFNPIPFYAKLKYQFCHLLIYVKDWWSKGDFRCRRLGFRGRSPSLLVLRPVGTWLKRNSPRSQAPSAVIIQFGIENFRVKATKAYLNEKNSSFSSPKNSNCHAKYIIL